MILSSNGGFNIMIVLCNALSSGRFQRTKDGHKEESEKVKVKQTERSERDGRPMHTMHNAVIRLWKFT